MRKFIVSLAVLIVTCFGFTAEAQRSHRVVSQNMVSGTPVSRIDQLKKNELAVMDNVLKVYGGADLSPLAKYLSEDMWAGPNPVVPAMAMAHAQLNRYENGGTLNDFATALMFFEFISAPNVHSNWGMRWASAPTASHLLCGIYRMKAAQVADNSLSARVDVLYNDVVRTIARNEANLVNTDQYPLAPYISGTPQDGDTKAEENAWTSTILAWASQMYPDEANAASWEKKGRELANFSIVRSSDQLFFNGNQVVTVEEDFTLTNHWVRGNPYYTVGTVNILRLGALAYYMTGADIPDEFEHNMLGMYGNYKVACGKDKDGRYVWLRDSDPVGDPTIFPIAGLGDDSFERSVVAQKVSDGYLWLPTEPVTTLVIDPEKGLTPGSSLGTMIQNGKVFFYYLEGSYLWHFPTKSNSR